MSSKTKKQLIILFSLLLTPVVIYFAIGLWFFGIPNMQARQRIGKEYSSITFPSYLHLTNKQWTDGSIDTAAEWDYSYTSDKSPEATFADLNTALKRAGYYPTSGSTYVSEITASKGRFFVDFNLSQHSVAAIIYESHNPGGR